MAINGKKKTIISKCVLCLLYVMIIFPMAFSMYNSVPASDDFAFGSNTISDNILLDAIGYSWWNWLYHSGRWLTFFVQKLINPLNMHSHLGRIYGIYMICLFMVIFLLIKYSLKVFFNAIIDAGKISIDVVVFLVITVLFTTYYYVETYNWYVGATAYALPLSLLFLSIALLIRFEETNDKKYFVGMILAGLIPATNEFLDVAIGLLYLYVAFYLYKKDFKDRKVVLNRLVPLIIFIFCGISVVFAPGNFVRQDGYDVEPNIVVALKQIAIDILVRIKDILFHHPLALGIFAGLLLCGIISGGSYKRKHIIQTIIITLIIIFGTIFPYVYGRAIDTTYLDVRMQYLVDYILLLGMCIVFLKFGMILADWGFTNWSNVIKVGLSAALIVLISIVSLHGDTYKKIMPIDIIRNHSLIQESYIFWDEVISEIETSPYEDVVITRVKDPEWTPYFLYMGLIEEDVYDVSFDTVYAKRKIMPNVYYQKKSIRIEYSAK